MAPVTLDEAEKLVEKEMARLNTELSGKRQELSKTQKEIGTATKELEGLRKNIALLQTDQETAAAQLKKVQEDIKSAQAKAAQALDAKEKGVNATIEKAELKIKEHRAAEKASHEAHQKVSGIVRDLEQTLTRFKQSVVAGVDKALSETQVYK